MADKDKSGIGKLRKLADDGRGLTDEARATVERLRGMDCARPRMDLYEIVFGVPAPTGASSRELNSAIRDRLIELIEHGGKQDADAHRERTCHDMLPDGMTAFDFSACMQELADLTLVEYEEAHAVRFLGEVNNVIDEYRKTLVKIGLMLGYENGDLPVLPELLLGELDKRLMPPRIEWPRLEDGGLVCFGSIVAGLDGPCEKFIFTSSMGGVCQLQDADGNIVNVMHGERVKRPQPEVLGADGLPIKVGQTVYGGDGRTWSVTAIRGGEYNVLAVGSAGGQRKGLRASWLTHAQPDTQARIDEDKHKGYVSYWGCLEHECCDCPATVDGKTPDERYGVVSCTVAQGMDIARREIELDAMTKGGER
ncbi:hypothetical protein FIC87_12520 [Eggerthella lenta]|uniref:Uncharacterized protein n=1 Tax=Eggerthella lenta TaxID=84112 RepID=A0A5C5BS62_EGGLN|nr:hypothetical protein [Eggerthella lenta]TNU89017.1 hypothetical protein FIC87_12520 [Eggerthella lenta]